MSGEGSERPTTPVGIGLVRRGTRFLIRPRPVPPMAGYWEFPGGKCEPGETPAEAVVRECLEETGLVVRPVAERAVIRHEYPHARVSLYYWDCVPESLDAEPGGATGFRWVEASQLASHRFPDANGPVVQSLAAEYGGPTETRGPCPTPGSTP